MATDWITDRRPTEADADEDGDVFVRNRPNRDFGVFIHWSLVSAGTPWQHTAGWEPPVPAPAAPEPPSTTPRKFVTLSRTVHEFGHTIDAIDEDGVAWWMVLGADEDPGIPWTQLTPLPAREVQADA